MSSYALPPAVPQTLSSPSAFVPPQTSQVPFSTMQRPVVPATAMPQRAPVEQVAPTVVQRISVNQMPSRSDLLKDALDWSWAEFRDYVCAEIICRFGEFPRDSRKEYGIFNRYLSTFGNHDSIRVAEYAFGPVCEGWWANAPISVNRFCKASDPYFSVPILDRLNDTN